MAGIQQVQVNQNTGLTFATALRSILRQDPDKIMIGEIRDQETLRIAIEAALTGHLVLSTLHTNDAVSAISRMQDMGIEDYLLAGAVGGIQAQDLLERYGTGLVKGLVGLLGIHFRITLIGFSKGYSFPTKELAIPIIRRVRRVGGLVCHIIRWDIFGKGRMISWKVLLVSGEDYLL